MGIVLVVHQASGSLAEAGAVSAAVWISAGVARPLQGRAIDRRGSRAVLLASGIVHAGALAALSVVANAGAPAWLLVTLGGVAGLGLPPVSLSMRIVWGRLVRPDERTAAYSLVYMTQEIAILTGPLIIALVVALSSPAPALVIAAAASGFGTIGYALSVSRSADRAATPARVQWRASVGLLPLLLVVVLIGGTLGSLQVTVPALAVARGVPALGGVLIACLSFGGIAGALVYGSRTWAADPGIRLPLLALLSGCAVTPLVTTPGLAITGLLLVLAGIGINPSWTTASLLVDRLRPQAAAEGFGWMSTAATVGTAAGSATSGVLAQHSGTSAAFLVAALSAYAAATVGLVIQRRSRLRAG